MNTVLGIVLGIIALIFALATGAMIQDKKDCMFGIILTIIMFVLSCALMIKG